MTLLELVRQIMVELGFPTPNGVVGSQDRTVVQIYALMNRLGSDLVRQHDWQRLQREHVVITKSFTEATTMTEGSPIVTVPDTSQLTRMWGLYGEGIRNFSTVQSIDSPTQLTLTMPVTSTGTFEIQFSQVAYPLPADWKNQIPQTEWDRTNRWPLMGPQTPQAWQSFKSGIVYAGPRERFRIIGNTISLNPPPPDGLLLAYEYISKNFVLASDGQTTKPSFTDNDDTTLFDDSLIITGTKARFLQAKGLDSSIEQADFIGLLNVCKAQDASAQALSLSPAPASFLLTNRNIPDGDWNIH